MKKLLAQITNPALPQGEKTITDLETGPLVPLIVRIWRALVVLGGIALLLYLIWGALDWLMSEGNPEKVKAARAKISHALIGMALLAGSFAIVVLMEKIFGFDILNIIWPSANPPGVNPPHGPGPR